MRVEDPEDVAGPSRFRPSAEWIEAFRRQYSDALALLVADYATARVTGAGARQHRDLRYPRALVMRVLTDTLVGVVRWDHTSTSLRDHVVKVIGKRSKIKWNRARGRAEYAYRHLYIDTTSASGRSRALEEADRLTFQLRADQARALEDLGELAARAADDPDLLAYLIARCYEESPTEAARLAGLSPSRYQSVRRRLYALIRALNLETSAPERSEERKP